MPRNVEIKARCENPEKILATLIDDLNAQMIGIDHQIDTYFKVPKGGLKLREGNIENSLIHFQRPEDRKEEGTKRSEVMLYTPQPGPALKILLLASLDVKVIVDKERHILFIDNVKFHVDKVNELGSFVEIEAIDNDGSIDQNQLSGQCRHYMDILKINQSDLIQSSYSDMIMSKTRSA